MAEQRGQHYYNSPYKFSGKELDEETGLYYYGARYYDPKVSIWLSVDPLAEEYPNIGGYTYCANNPINIIDPDGRFLLDVHQRITKNALNGFKFFYNEKIKLKPMHRHRRNTKLNYSFIHGIRGEGTVFSGGVTYPDIHETHNKSSHFDQMNYSQIVANYKSLINEIPTLVDSFEKGSGGDNLGFEVGKNLHAIQDFYSHSNYIELYESVYGQTDVSKIPTLMEALNNKKYSNFADVLKTDLVTGRFPGTGEGSHREMNHDVGAGSNYTSIVPETKGKKVNWNTRAAEAAATRASKEYLNIFKNEIEKR